MDKNIESKNKVKSELAC